VAGRPVCKAPKVRQGLPADPKVRPDYRVRVAPQAFKVLQARVAAVSPACRAKPESPVCKAKPDCAAQPEWVPKGRPAPQAPKAQRE
jgi:hypothetical protein